MMTYDRYRIDRKFGRDIPETVDLAPYQSQTISRRFGSWDAALVAAGLPINHRPGSNR